MTLRRIAPSATLTPEVLDARVAGGLPFPIVDESVCTFAYRGPVIEVRLVHFGVGLPADLAFSPLGESGWWLLALEMPRGSRLEYKLEVVDSFGNHLVEDPLNRLRASNPFGANSVCQAAGYIEPSWAVHDPRVAGGELLDRTVDSAALGRQATATVYVPAGFTRDWRTPLLVVHDGHDYLHYAGLKTVLDNLIHRGELPPTVAILSQPVDRLREYAADARHAEFVTSELVPSIEAELGLQPTADDRCLMGSSFGAVASLAAAVRSPDYFGRLLLQSGSFAGAGTGCRPRPEPLWRPVRHFVQEYLADPVPVAQRVFVSCGEYESLICENRGLLPVLQRTGMDVRFVETPDGHNWACWRDSLGLALPWLLTGKH